jgi:integrase
MSRRATWSKTVEEAGVQVRIFEREHGSQLYRSVVVNGRKDRKSLGHHDRRLAEEQAKALARALAEARLTGRTDGRLPLGQLFDLYRRYRVPVLKPPRAREAAARMSMFEKAWGREFNVRDVSQAHVDNYVRLRRALEVVSPGLERDENGKPRRGYRTPKPIRDGAVHGEVSWLSSVFNFAHNFKVDGRRLLSENPLHGVDWPKERNPRRPIASHQRFTATIEHADAVDPAGRLRAILALARWTGRRESAICALRASDVLLSPERIRGALAEAGMDERLGDHMPNGGVRWAAEHDKQGFLFISPMSARARAALDAYLARNPRVGDVPLFPAPLDASKPIRRDTAAGWLLQAERLAQQPKLVGGVFHPYRRLWATERKGLADADVAAAGGWRDTRALRQSYQTADPVSVLRAVEHEA